MSYLAAYLLKPLTLCHPVGGPKELFFFVTPFLCPEGRLLLDEDDRDIASEDFSVDKNRALQAPANWKQRL
jgi:hypothetical protein